MTDNDKIIHDQFSRYGRNAKEWMHKCVLMLPKIEKNRIWEKKGFGSIYEYAAKLSGMSRYKVTDSLRIIRRIKDKPEIMKVAKQKGLNAVRPVAAVATEESDKFWAEKSKEMTKNTLETFVKDFKTESGPRTTSHSNNSTHKLKVLMELDPEILEALTKLKGKGDWNETMKKLLKPKAVQGKSRNTPVRIKKFIQTRSQGRCEHPNCHKPASQLHHSESFALNKEHNPDKMHHLCKAHHQIIHHGYIDETESWQQISSLPSYDIKNRINDRIADFQNYKQSTNT